MKTTMCIPALLLAALLTGCATTEPPRATLDPTQPKAERMVGEVIDEAGDARMEFYNDEGKKVDSLPSGEPGSVSIFLSDGTGQDNYSFDEQGVVVRHMRSHGDHYNAGVWVDITEESLGRDSTVAP